VVPCAWLGLRPRVAPAMKSEPDPMELNRYMTQPFLIGDYRFSLLDMLSGTADAEPELVHQDWVASIRPRYERTGYRRTGSASPRTTIVRRATTKGQIRVEPATRFSSSGAPSRIWRQIDNGLDQEIRTRVVLTELSATACGRSEPSVRILEVPLPQWPTRHEREGRGFVRK